MPALTLSNVLACVAQTTAIVAGVAWLVRAVRLSSPRARIAIWRALLGVCLVLPFAPPLMPELALPLPQLRLAQATSAVADGEIRAQAAGKVAPRAAVTGDVPARRVGALLAAGALARVAWLLVGLASLRRLGRGAARVAPPAVEWAQARVGITADFCATPLIAQPATFGVMRPVVLLPEAFPAWPIETQRAVATHELLHVRRGDWAQGMVEEAIRCVVWFHPAAWWLVDRIRLAREQIVDREVVRLTGDRGVYLRALLDLASAPRPARPAPASASAFFRRPQLLERVAHLTKEVPMARLRFAASLASVGIATLALTMSAVRAFPVQVASSPALLAASGAQAAALESATQQPPAPVTKVPVAYPDAARAAAVEGPVVLQVTTSADGAPSDVQAVGGAPELTEAATAALWRWRFEPRTDPSTFIIGVNVRPGAAEKGIDAKALRVGGAIKPPTKVADVRPVYPPEAKADGVQGVVILEASIGADGSVSMARVIRAVDARLDAAALDAVLRWQFTPTLLNGAPVPLIMTVTVNFTLA